HDAATMERLFWRPMPDWSDRAAVAELATATPRWRERLPELAMPALVLYGRRDPFFPVGNAEALAREIPGARLLVLERPRPRSPMRSRVRSRQRRLRSGPFFPQGHHDSHINHHRGGRYTMNA